MITLKAIFAIQWKTNKPHYLDDYKITETIKTKNTNNLYVLLMTFEVKNAFTESYSAT